MTATLVRFEAADGLVGYRSPALAELGVPHLFSTRHGGDAGTPLAPEEPAATTRLARESGAPTARVVTARQVHGADVSLVREDGEEPPVADALVTTRADRLLLIRTADCVPVLLACADGACVAAVHAGWRGLVAGAIPRALSAMAELGAPAAVAAVGPCLSRRRFEVGAEVADAFVAAELADEPASHLDLRDAAQRQLVRGGVRRLDVSASCTWDDPDLYSHRRDVTHGPHERTGRLGALVAPRVR